MLNTHTHSHTHMNLLVQIATVRSTCMHMATLCWELAWFSSVYAHTNTHYHPHKRTSFLSPCCCSFSLLICCSVTMRSTKRDQNSITFLHKCTRFESRLPWSDAHNWLRLKKHVGVGSNCAEEYPTE